MCNSLAGNSGTAQIEAKLLNKVILLFHICNQTDCIHIALLPVDGKIRIRVSLVGIREEHSTNWKSLLKVTEGVSLHGIFQ